MVSNERVTRRRYDSELELVSKELNHLAAILHVYAGRFEVKEKYHCSGLELGI